MSASYRFAPAARRSGVAIPHKPIVWLLILALGSILAAPAIAKVPQALDPATVESLVNKFGIGKDVKIQLLGGQRLRGHIASIGENSFAITTAKTHQKQEIPYKQVSQIKDPSPITWMLVGAGVVVIIILVAR